MRDVAIRGDMIRLGQLLKLAGVVDSGGELKALLADTDVLVNGELEDRRGRQLHGATSFACRRRAACHVTRPGDEG